MIPTRQLAAIMFTDIVGYSALMGNDEKKAFEILKKNRELQKPIIEKFNGRLIKELGDGVMASFSTITDAVNAAIQIQEACNAGNYFQLRIGIHQGEMIFENGDVFGDGVNMASRIQDIAIPGSVYISESVYQNISNKQDIQTLALGKYNLKNIKEPVEIYAIRNQGIKIPDSVRVKENGKASGVDCVLVLPFVNMSNDASQEFFNDGLTDELITNLSKLTEVKVISRTTSMQYKETTKDIKTIGIETGARYIMEGSVRRHENNLKITAQFLDAKRDIHIWAENYRGTMDDIFDIQEQVATKIVDALRIQLSRSEINTLQKRYTENSKAYQLYLKGRYFWNIRNEDSLKNALKYFEMAIELEPGYAVAWSGIADAYILLGEFTNLSRQELYPKAKQAVNKALEIDPRLAEAHFSKGLLLMLNEWDWTNAEIEYRKGIELNANYATGHQWFSEWLLYTGNTKEAIAEISRAVELDPVSPAILKDKGMTYYYARQYDKAIELAEKSLEMNPGFTGSYRLLSLAYLAKGMYDEAIENNRLWGNMTGINVKTEVALCNIYAVAGRTEELMEIIDRVTADMEFYRNDYRGMAIIYSSLGQPDNAFYWLDKSFELNEESLCSLKVDPKMDPIRSDPRFNALLKKIGLDGNRN